MEKAAENRARTYSIIAYDQPDSYMFGGVIVPQLVQETTSLEKAIEIVKGLLSEDWGCVCIDRYYDDRQEQK